MKRWVVRAGFLFTILPLLAVPTPALELTFNDRVAAQRAIEEVYWRHRIWPQENRGAKPALGDVLTESAIRAKVREYLKLLDALRKAAARGAKEDVFLRVTGLNGNGSVDPAFDSIGIQAK